ncbi:MAG: CPBP family intramembrane metalloprotease [Candidatus Obscuribacterales bacterium]|nr:CPBP family intramembrane metalloprotease [Candidatus Obscuribacterales bacterium]
MKTTTCESVGNFLFPEGRLSADFPWTWKRAAKAYFITFGLFMLGSFLPVLIFITFMLGSQLYFPEFHETAMRLIANPDGMPNMGFMVALTVTSFLMGMGLELDYIRKELAKDGHSLRGVVGMNLDKIPGNSFLAKSWGALWRAGLAYLGFSLFSALALQFLPQPEQPTIDFIRSLSGHALSITFVLVAIGAPLFEELIFRGFLFQMFRGTFRQGRWFAALASNPKLADLAAVVLSAAAFAFQHLQFHPTTLLFLFLMGCLLAELYRRTGSLIPSMILHAINNAVSFYLATHSH